MMKKLFLLTALIILILLLCGCGNTHDTINIYNKSTTVFDDIFIDAKDGYFYDRHEKFIVDENSIGVTVYFSKIEDGEWELKGGGKE